MNKRLLALLLACLLAFGGMCLADGESPEAEQTAAPTAEPTPEPSPDPTEAPSEEPTAEPTEEPSEAPTQEPSAEPSEDPTEAPTREPTVESTPKPTEFPAALTIRVENEGAAQGEDEVWQIPFASPEDMLRFAWGSVEGASEYSWQITDAEDNLLNSGTCTEAMLELPARDYASGLFTLTIQAQAGETALEAKLTFALVQSENPGERPGGFPGGFPSGFRGGFGGFRSAGSGGMPGEAQGFRVTPGEALTSAHASGSKDMSLYGTVALDIPEAPMIRLTLGDAELDVALAGGGSFTAELQEDALLLLPESSAEEWTVSALALRTLHKSGVTALTLSFDGGSAVLPTDLEFSGAIYANYRAQGCVSKDFALHISAAGTVVTVDGARYQLNRDGELVPE